MTRSNRSLLVLLAALLLLLPAAGAAAQSPDADEPEDTEAPEDLEPAEEPLLDALDDQLKNDYFELGLFLQGVADFQPERLSGVNGFQLAKARLSAQGTLDSGWGYKLQSDFSRDVSLLDALVSYRFTDWLGAQAGLFKAPFSYEYLVSSKRIPFVGRSQVINNLAPKRQVGVTLTTTPAPGITLQGGLFNGNGRTAVVNDNNRFLYTGRLEVTPQRAPVEALTLGTSVAYNDRSNLYERNDGTIVYAADPGALTDAEAVGSTLLLGGDVHARQGSWLAGAEFIYGRLTERGRPEDRAPLGHYVTVGYTLPTHAFQQVLLRWDTFTPDAGDAASSDLLVAGYTLRPTSFIEMQFNYAVSADDPAFDNHQLLADIQIAW